MNTRADKFFAGVSGMLASSATLEATEARQDARQNSYAIPR